VISRHRAPLHPCPEKPNAWARPPKPPRVTPPEPESEEPVDDEWLDDESPPKKLYPDDLREPLPDEPCDDDDEQDVVVCGSAGAAIPGGGVPDEAGPQLSRGISA
jgi:hypothetical protein